MSSWIDRYWSYAATVAILVAGALVLFSNESLFDGGADFAIGGVAVAALVGVWTIEHLRRDLIASHRPYLGVTSTANSAPDMNGNLLVEIHVTNVGRSPGAILEERSTHIVNNVVNNLVPGVTESNAVFPGERINIPYETTVGARITWECEYTSVGPPPASRRRYRFAVTYLVEANGTPAIVRKVVS